MRALVPGRHRRTIRHLAPDTVYEVEVRQGGRYWRAETRTKAYKPRKVSVALGVVDGDVAIRQEAGAVVVERSGAGPLRLEAGRDVYVEIHSGLVRNGGVRVAAPRVILRDVDILGAPDDAIRLEEPGAPDLRLVRCRGASWGWATTPETGFPNGVGFARMHTSFLSVPPKAGSVDGVLMIGCQVGAPRFSANTWQELDGAFLPDNRKLAVHPDGSNVIGVIGDRFVGRGWNVRDCVMRAVGTRLYDDCVRGGGNRRFDGGVGLELVWAYNACGGAADDTIEVEGANVCTLVLGNLVDQTRLRRWTTAPQHAIGCSSVMWGPLECERNLYVFGAYPGPEAEAAPRKVRSIYKLGRGNDGRRERGAAVAAEVEARGWFVAYHETALRDADAPVAQSVVGVGDPVVRVIAENNVFSVMNPVPESLTARDERENFWGASNLQVTSPDALPRRAGAGPWWEDRERRAADAAAPLANVNDGGPWGSSRRDLGATGGPKSNG
jgi:hypothetical protein